MTRKSAKPFQSKLRPFVNEIRKWRRAGLTWAQVADRLKEQGCETQATNVCQFMRRYRRRPYPSEAAPEEILAPSPSVTPSVPPPIESPRGRRSLSIEELTEPAQSNGPGHDGTLFKVVKAKQLL